MNEFGSIGYAAAALLYTALSVLLLVNWRGQRRGGLLILACIVSVAWAGMIAANLSGWAVPKFALFTTEVLRSGAWLVFLTVLLARIGVGLWLRLLGYSSWIFVLLAGLVVQPGWLQDLDPALDLGVVLNPGGLVLAFIGLFLIEQLYRNTPADSPGGFKALALGIGGLFTYDLFLYSQGVLMGGIEAPTWQLRGAFNVLFVPLIAIAARSNPDWKMRIFVSRQVIYYSTSVAAVGVYLLLMGGVGYWLSEYGGTWGLLAKVVFLAGAVLLLALLLFSDKLKARTKVFLSKHFFHNKYDYREEWLRLIATLAAFEDSSTRQIVIKALAQIVQSPSGLLWVLDERQGSYKLAAAYATEADRPDIPADDPLVTFIRRDGWLIDLEEFKRDPRIYGDLEIPAWLSDSAGTWLIIPLITRQQLLGFAMLDKAAGPPKLNYEDRDLLKTAGNHIAVHLAQERTDALLLEARQFEAYNRLTAFLMHDLNNLIAQQSLIVSNASKHKRNPEFIDDTMQTIANSVDRMKRVMDQLKRGAAEKPVKTTELKFIASTAVDRCTGADPVPRLDLADGGALVEVDAEQFTMILAHLITNAQDATAADGAVTVSTECAEGYATVTVADNGAGMTSEFIRDRLFRPFDSTKGSQRMGIGAYQAREFARKSGGDLRVSSEIGQGTTVMVSLPVQ